MNLHFTDTFPFGGETGFENKIINNQKIHTIRVDKENLWKEGEIIHFVKGENKEDYSCYMVGVCTQIQPIEIDYQEKLIIRIDAKLISEESIAHLAQNDGFDSLVQFEKWFVPIIKNEGVFKGKLIHWTDFSY